MPRNRTDHYDSLCLYDLSTEKLFVYHNLIELEDNVIFRITPFSPDNRGFIAKEPISRLPPPESKTSCSSIGRANSITSPLHPPFCKPFGSRRKKTGRMGANSRRAHGRGPHAGPLGAIEADHALFPGQFGY